jgi:hypothetical protein
VAIDLDSSARQTRHGIIRPVNDEFLANFGRDPATDFLLIFRNFDIVLWGFDPVDSYQGTVSESLTMMTSLGIDVMILNQIIINARSSGETTRFSGDEYVQHISTW